MTGYKDCSIEQFNEAMRMVSENVPVQDIPTHLLYIAFDKYCADERHLGMVSSTPYISDIRLSTKNKKKMLGTELKRRGIEIQM